MRSISRLLSVALLCLCLFSCGENNFTATEALTLRKEPNMMATLYFQNGTTTTISVTSFSAQPVNSQSLSFVNTGVSPSDSYTVIRADIQEPDQALILQINNTNYENKSEVRILPKSSSELECRILPDNITISGPGIVGEENDEV